MDTILVHSGLGLSLTIILQFLLLGTAAGKRWPTTYIALLLSLCSLLTLSAFAVFSWVPNVAFLMLASAAVLNAFKNRTRLHELFKCPSFPKIQYLGILALLILIVFSATPAFRSDQWTYHLMVSKIISQTGELAPPIFNDHIFFSGTYEYIFLWGRQFTQNDTIIQSFANSFGVTSCLIAIIGILREVNGKSHPTLLPILVSFIFFAIPTQDIIYNAKGDWLLIVGAVLVLNSISKLPNISRLEAVSLGFFLAAIASVKLTWLPFGVVAGFVLALSLVRCRAQHLLPISFGVILGAIVCLPYLIKNIHYFGNPIHPAQIGLETSYWSTAMAEYWGNNNKAARNIQEYFQFFMLSIVESIKLGAYLLAPACLIALINRGMPKEALPASTQLNQRTALFVLIGYIAIWPIFFEPETYPRFLYPLIGILTYLTIKYLGPMFDKKWTMAILILPALLTGSLEVKVKTITENSLLDKATFYKTGKLPLIEAHYYDLLNKERDRLYPHSTRNQNILLTDNNSSYFFHGAKIFANGYDYQWLADKVDAYKCPFTFARKHDIKFLLLWKDAMAQEESEAPDWPEELLPLIHAASPINQSPYLLHLSSSVSTDGANNEQLIGCGKESS